MTNVGSSLTTAIKDKFYEGEDLYKCECQTLLWRVYQEAKVSNNSDFNNKIKEFKRQLDAVEAKKAKTDYDSDSDSSDTAYNINGRINKRKCNLMITGYCAGSYWPVKKTNNKRTNRTMLTQCGLMNGPMDQDNTPI